MTFLPPDLGRGKVVARLIEVIGDGDDEGRDPDAEAPIGVIRISPMSPFRMANLSEPTYVLPKTLACGVDEDGYLIDPQGEQGVWLAVGDYRVTYEFPEHKIPAQEIAVTAEHTDEAPLDLTTVAPNSSTARVTPTQLAALTARVDALDAATGGIEYVSGAVTPDPSIPVHEYFTTGAATIDGVEYPARSAVVLFNMGSTWVHKTVDLPLPPSVELVGSYYDASTNQSTWSFTGTGSTTESGLLVACVYTTRRAANVTVGGSVLPRVVDVAGWANPTPSMHALPVGPGHPLDDVQISLTEGTGEWVAIDLLLVTGVDPAPYLVVEPDESSSNGAYAPDAPLGSIVISCHVARGPSGFVQPTVWLDPMNELTNQFFPGNYAVGDPRETWHIRPSSGWGRHAGNGALRLATTDSELFAIAVFKEAVR